MSHINLGILTTLKNLFRQIIRLVNSLFTDSKEPATACSNKQFALTALKQARLELSCAQNYFDFIDDTDLLDYSIYHMLAAECKFSYYLNLARLENSCPEALPADLTKTAILSNNE